ncbi:MAG: hypothetical protein HY352_02770 [Candidatus Omnitrophica bacterium]|nr:hypothetical protein [Candidatus Omnitrophota bacterium]
MSLVIAAAMWGAPEIVCGEVPRTIHYQGKLTETNGSPLVGDHAVTVRLYGAATGGVALWQETHQISLKREDNGIFAVVLGSTTPFGASMTFNDPLWLTTEIDGAGEFTPRQPLSAVGYAINANTLDGMTATQLLALTGTGAISAASAGAGLTAGTSGDVTTLNVGAGTGIVVGADAVSVNVGTAAGRIVQLDGNAALPAVSGANLTSLNAANLSTGTVPDARLSSNVSLLGSAVESSELTDGTVTAADTSATFLIAGSGVTVTKDAASWQIDATGAGGTITGVTAGAGLTGGGTSGAVTLTVGAGNGIQANADDLAVQLSAGSGLLADATGVSLLRSCTDGQLLKWNATSTTWQCAADADTNSGGTVTSITAGTGLSASPASPITTAGTLAVDVGTTAGKIVQLDGSGALPAVSGANLTALDASTLTTGTVADARLSSNVSLLGSSIESADVADGTLTADDTVATFLTAGSGITVARASGAWQIATSGGGGTITGVTAGTGLTGGGTTGDVTVSLSTPVTVANGGTGSTTAGGARTNLGAAASGANSDITSLSGLTTTLSVVQGGTGATTITNGALVIGRGTSAIATTGVLAKGSLLVGDGATDPTLLSVGGDDTILMADSTQTGGVKWATGCMPIGGADDASRSATFQVATFGPSGTAGRADQLWPVPVAGTMSSLRAFVNTAPGTGDSWTVTLRKNDANTTQSCAIAGSDQSCATAGASVSVVAGDRVGAEFVETGSASGTTGSGWSACFIPN